MSTSQLHVATCTKMKISLVYESFLVNLQQVKKEVKDLFILK